MENFNPLYKSLLKDIFNSYIKNSIINVTAFKKIEIDTLISFLAYHRIDLITYDCLERANNQIHFKIHNAFNLKRKLIQGKISNYRVALEELLLLFDKHSIQFILLKGISLVSSEYKQDCHRYFNDIDILIDPSQIDKTEQMLIELGYVYGNFRNGYIKNADRSMVLYQRMHTHEIHNMVKVFEDGFVGNVDINFLFSWKGITNEKMLSIPMQTCLENSRAVEYHDMKFLILNPEFQVLHLCCHFYNESLYFALNQKYKGDDPKELLLIRLLDILMVVYNNSVDLNKVIDISSEYNCSRKIRYTFNLMNYLFDNDIIKSDIFAKSDLLEENIFYKRDGSKWIWPLSLNDRIVDVVQRETVKLPY